MTQVHPQPISQENKTRTQDWFRILRDDLCQSLESLEPNGKKFEREVWKREEESTKAQDLGGGEMSLLKGDIFEKAGVHISTVYGELSPAFRAQVEGADKNPRFWASGISVIVHPKNPNVPAAHMNTRMVVTSKNWFGGGCDLTPVLKRDRRDDHPDTVDFHAACKTACDAYDTTYYPEFKAECDTYFYLPHRKEHRGTGGIFYDHLNTGDWEKDFSFTQNVGRSFLQAYPMIAKRRMNDEYTDADRAEQLVRRGRYVEFNLLYDRGTMFGLKTGGNVESILSSMPPLVSWP